MTEHVADLRSRAYGALALAYHGAPATETVTRAAALVAEARARGDHATGDAMASLAERVPSEADEAVRQDFHDLFLVPTPRYVRPYESVHADAPLAAGDRAPIPANFGPSTVAISRFYERVGLKVAPDYNELPDFVGLELACMEFLCDREGVHHRTGDREGVRHARSAQAEFLNAHMLRWIPRLAASVRGHAATRFHIRLADATARLLASDEKRICVMR